MEMRCDNVFKGARRARIVYMHVNAQEAVDHIFFQECEIVKAFLLVWEVLYVDNTICETYNKKDIFRNTIYKR